MEELKDQFSWFARCLTYRGLPQKPKREGQNTHHTTLKVNLATLAMLKGRKATTNGSRVSWTLIRLSS